MNQPTQSIQELAKEKLQEKFDSSKDENPRVAWWDPGGHLRPVVEKACRDLDVVFLVGDENPLILRQKTLDHSEQPQVWYIPEAKEGREWFRDVRETGSEIELAVHELAAGLYPSVNAWDICDKNPEDEGFDELGKILVRELSDESFVPSFNELRYKLITQGEGRPLEYIIKNGWGMEADENTIGKVRDMLRERGLEDIIERDEGPNEIVEKARHWAVAQWLIGEGVEIENFPEEFHGVQTTFKDPVLKKVLEENQNEGLEEIFLQQFWPKVLADFDDVWKYSLCPVDGSLEFSLWNDWIARFKDKEYEKAESDAKDRYHVLEDTYGKDTPVADVWRQAANLAALAKSFSFWEEREINGRLVEDYTNQENGGWRIDRAVRKIITSGEPELKLEINHPAKDDLSEIRNEFLQKKYIDYLDQLSDDVVDAFNDGYFLENNESAHRFWQDHKEELASGQTVAIFYIDALRFDLAKELAEELRTEDFEVREERRMACFPTETKFGMGALTPGNRNTFAIEMQNGELVATRNGQKISTSHRENLLENEGWSVTRDGEDGWSFSRVSFFDQELDKIGEEEMSKIEAKLETRISELSDLIGKKMEQGDWERVFVVTDHGFVLLPRGTEIGKISPPESAEDVSRRFIAGENLEDTGYGVSLDKDNSNLNYLDADITVLVDPFHRFRKQGIKDSRYFHGGGMPQEFVFNFLEIEQS